MSNEYRENWAPVIGTLILACLTAWYAWETRRIVRSMEKAREDISRPVLSFQLVPWQSNILKLRIQNVGGGPAVGVKGTIETCTKSGSVSVPWSYVLLGADKYEEFGFPMLPGWSESDRFSFNAIKEKVVEVRAKFAYKSIYGVKYELRDSIQIQEVTSAWMASRMMATQDHPERIMPRIAKTLEDIKEELGKLQTKRD